MGPIGLTSIQGVGMKICISCNEYGAQLNMWLGSMWALGCPFVIFRVRVDVWLFVDVAYRNYVFIMRDMCGCPYLLLLLVDMSHVE